MDDLTPEQVLGIAAACVVGVVGLGALACRCLYPREFAVFFGLKLRSTPRSAPRGRRPKPVASDAPIVLVDNPVVVKQARIRDVLSQDTPLKVKRMRKEFSVARVVGR